LFGLFMGRLNSWALLGGWVIGMLAGTALAWGPTTWTPTHTVFGWFSAYNGLIALALNTVAACFLSAFVVSDATGEQTLAAEAGGMALGPRQT
jgi:Na+/proline symporter